MFRICYQYLNLQPTTTSRFSRLVNLRPSDKTFRLRTTMSGQAGRQSVMVADEMFPDGPGAGLDFADVEDVVRDNSLLSDLTASDKTVHADFFNNFGDLFDDNDLP